MQNLPGAVVADNNHGGMPDAYWDNNLTLRRIDDNDRVDSDDINDPGHLLGSA